MIRCELTDKQIEDITNRFAYHKPKNKETEERYGDGRAALAAIALGILQETPPSREQALALTKLEECMFWANAAIARNEK